jgi:acetyltransferase-like isoleucine patch superfamily enzyme
VLQLLHQQKEHFLDRLTRSVIRRGAPQMAGELLNQPRIFGPRERLHLAESAIVNDALFNTTCGEITIGEWGMIAHGACLATGTHDVTKFNLERQLTAPFYDCDITLEEGAWVATNSLVIGPCRIGRHAVVAAGSLVRHDVPAYTVVAGSPARVISELQPTSDV